MTYYDRQGQEITFRHYIKLNRDPYRRVGYSIIGPYKVSTVWLGSDYNYGYGKMLFETMVFSLDSYRELYSRRYGTEAEAIIGHTKAIYLAGLGKWE
jgi:hypothetical protein